MALRPNTKDVPVLPPAFGGFDRYNPPETKWMDAVLHGSNFSFTWYYLSHWPNGPRDNPHPNGLEGTKVKRVIKETWAKAFPDILPQGWGFVLTYLPLS